MLNKSIGEYSNSAVVFLLLLFLVSNATPYKMKPQTLNAQTHPDIQSFTMPSTFYV